MENISKFLLIAGGILITMITISVFYLMFDKSGEVADAMQQNTTQKELMAFNTGFEAYNKKAMYGIDVISVINKAIDNNKDYEGTVLYDNYKVEILVDGKSMDYIYDNYIRLLNVKEKELSKEEKDRIHDFKFSAFKCTKVEYVKPSDIKSQSSSDAVRQSMQNDI